MLSFDASIYDSYLGYEDFKLSLEGDIAFRICWGAQPDFVTSGRRLPPGVSPRCAPAPATAAADVDLAG
jgi:hypothetical protein